MTNKTWPLAAAALCICLSSSIANAGDPKLFDVTVTNLTRSQSFTDLLVVSHSADIALFELGTPASTELAALAESGDPTPFIDLLSPLAEVHQITTNVGLLEPGKTVTVRIEATDELDRISVAAMLIPTNDTFVALDSRPVPRGLNGARYGVPAFDAGSEPNDELCANIPGPVCNGEGGSPDVDGEGYVHISSGIHGIGLGELAPESYDWRNPVAAVTIERAN